MSVEQRQVLTPGECERAVAAVRELREHWIDRSRGAGRFFTLGVNAYMDLATRQLDYHARAPELNVLLREHLGWLLEAVAGALERELGEPVTYEHPFALPGCHVFVGEGVPTRPTSSVHFDLQYVHLPWHRVGQPDMTRPVSYTLPLELPSGGSGLNVWDLTHDEMQRAVERGYATTVAEMQRFKQMSYVPYDLGALYVHDGHLLHQIAPAPAAAPDDARITLQGHGMRCDDGAWRLYW